MSALEEPPPLPPLPSAKRDRERLAVDVARIIWDRLLELAPDAAPSPTGAQGLEALPEPPRLQSTVYGANPAAGQDAIYRSSATPFLPLSVMVTLTTSNVAAERSVALEYRTGDNTRYLIAGTSVCVNPSSTQTFCWHPAAAAGVWPVEDAALAALPQQWVYTPCYLAVKVWNGDAGDRLSAFRLSVQPLI